MVASVNSVITVFNNSIVFLCKESGLLMYSIDIVCIIGIMYRELYIIILIHLTTCMAIIYSKHYITLIKLAQCHVVTWCIIIQL